MIRRLSKMAHLDSAVLKSKFRGSLLGGLLGDCLGAPYEGDFVSAGDKIIIQRYFDTLESPDFKGPIRQYTDDTAMVKSVARALIDKPEPDYKFMAKLFVQDFFEEPNRGYGENVVKVFHKLRKTKFEDIYKPASEQFNGGGSYGNGGAMRIAPVALFFHPNYPQMIEAARLSTKITHTNPRGVIGAILQCIAVAEALKVHPSEKIDKKNFLQNILKKIEVIESENDDDFGNFRPFCGKLKLADELLDMEHNAEFDEKVVEILGNSISAYESVVTALFCFLKALDEIPTVKTDNVFRRTIQYAITLGGDTDTIACMAGSIAGAYLGEDSINKNMMKHCEFHEEIVEMADCLFEATIKH